MAIVSTGRSAKTDFVRLARFDATDLLRAHLQSGRTHQIRVHLASVGHPVAGDDTYGGGGGRRLIALPARRHFLHAAWLRFRHPVVRSSDGPSLRRLPDDLRRSLAAAANDPALESNPDPLDHFGFYRDSRLTPRPSDAATAAVRGRRHRLRLRHRCCSGDRSVAALDAAARRARPRPRPRATSAARSSPSSISQLGSRGRPRADDGSVVLAEYGNKSVGLAVDEVRDVQILAPERFEPATGDLARGGIVRGLGHLDDGVVIVLEVPAVIRQVMA